MRQDPTRPAVKVSQVWSGDEGNEPWQYVSLRALDASRGNAFALVPKSDTILVANFRYLLRINAQTGREEVLRISLRDPKYAPVIEFNKTRAQTAACFTGLTSHANKLYALVETYKSDLLLVLDERGEVLQSCPIGQPGALTHLKERSKRVFPSVKLQELIRLRFLPPDNLFAFACGYQENGRDNPPTCITGSLHQYTLKSSECPLKRQWRSITGCAVAHSGEILVSGSPIFRQGLQVVAPPSELDPRHWSLIGVDHQGLLYWRSLYPIREKMLGRSIIAWLTHLACSDRDGRLRWQIEIDGSPGILASLAPRMTTYAHGWIEVAEDGTIWVFAVHLDIGRERKDVVGLYKIQVLT